MAKKKATYCHGLRWFCLRRAAPLLVRPQRVILPKTSNGPLRTYKRENRSEKVFHSGSISSHFSKHFIGTANYKHKLCKF